MGKKESKPEPPPVEEKDDRWELSRNFGPKVHEFRAKLEELKHRPIDQAIPRPVHSSVYFRQLPQYQGMWTCLAIWTCILRKMPFTNPLTRLAFWVFGVDFIRSRTRWVSLPDENDMKQLRCFDRMFHMVKHRYGVRMPDFKNEWEDWYEMNKPAYRVAIPHEDGMDSWMRYIALNYRTYRLRPVKWEGKWEQEMCLNMDLHAPHTDHWLDIH